MTYRWFGWGPSRSPIHSLAGPIGASGSRPHKQARHITAIASHQSFIEETYFTQGAVSTRNKSPFSMPKHTGAIGFAASGGVS
jgi:hypothetical protein